MIADVLRIVCKILALYNTLETEYIATLKIHSYPTLYAPSSVKL